MAKVTARCWVNVTSDSSSTCQLRFANREQDVVDRGDEPVKATGSRPDQNGTGVLDQRAIANAVRSRRCSPVTEPPSAHGASTYASSRPGLRPISWSAESSD